jgi:hypothetical protein
MSELWSVWKGAGRRYHAVAPGRKPPRGASFVTCAISKEVAENLARRVFPEDDIYKEGHKAQAVPLRNSGGILKP